LAVFVLALVIAASCSSGGQNGAPVATGGASATGGAAAAPSGGVPASGGVTATGGITSSGGVGTGGAPSSGGKPVGDASAGDDGGDAAGGPVVTVKEGSLRGIVDGETQVFRNIPFAAPPVGTLRFAPPAKALPWSGVRDASAFGYACPQGGVESVRVAEEENEDCLTLNVYAPAGSAKAGAPVMVFLFGGGFSSGAGSVYDGRRLSEAGDVVVVTVNYRLGPLGFMTHESLDAAFGVPSGNMGFRDQQASLRWVRDNIAAFGGDPGNVTLFGESAGAVSACLHVFAKESRALAHKFILESGGCLSLPVLPMKRSNIDWLSAKLVADLCKDSSDKLACLRALPADKLTKWTDTTAKTDPGPDPLGQQFWPQMDGAVFEDYPKRLAASGDFNRGPILMGTAENEAEFYRIVGAKQVNTAVNLGFYLLAAYPTTWQALVPHYTPASDAEANAAWDRLTTDTWYRCPTRATARALSAKGSAVYLYDFALRPAVHTQELDYVFGYPIVGDLLTAPPLSFAAPNPPPASLVTAMQSYWTTFAKTGVPTRGGSPEWPRYETATDRHLVLDDAVTAGSALAKPQCDSWDQANASAPN
jgi:para-nitrobenzyl esterase